MWTSIKMLDTQPVVHDHHSGPFSRSNEPRSVHGPRFADDRLL